MPVSNSTETASTLVVGAVGMTLPEIINNWVSIFVGIVSGIWVTYQLVSAIKRDIRRARKFKKRRS